MKTKTVLLYEEIANSVTHGLGAVAGIIISFLMLFHAYNSGNSWYFGSVIAFCLSLILLYSASTIYHAYTGEKGKLLLRKFDHSAIFIFIAGTYTPFTLVTLREQDLWGWTIFGIVWTAAIAGTVISFCHMKGSWVKTLCYLLMGWVVIIAIKPMVNVLRASDNMDVFYWLIAGGVFYTLGTVFYTLDKYKFMHAIWHLFVLGGSLCHVVAVYKLY